jgi:hypothetical protein
MWLAFIEPAKPGYDKIAAMPMRHAIVIVFMTKFLFIGATPAQ